MKRHHTHLLALVCAVLLSPAGAQTTVPAAAAASAPARPPAPVFPTAPPPPYVTPETPQGTGPFPAIMETDPGLPTHTVYRPAALDKLGSQKLPIVAWGNGACVNAGNRFRYFLTEIASHGFIVVALGPIVTREVEQAGSGSAVVTPPAVGSPAAILQAAAGQDAPPPKIPGPAHTTAAQLSDAINWAITENARRGSRYVGRIATDQIAVMGQSCGGLQAIDIARRDPRVKTLGVWNSGLFPNTVRAAEIAAAYVDKADLKKLHGSAIYITGDASDQAKLNADDDFARIEGIPAFRAWREQTGHGGTYRESGGGAFGQVAVAWLRWQLKGSEQAGAVFKGLDCGLCKQPEWHVLKKQID